MADRPTYLGDAVYASKEGDMIRLETSFSDDPNHIYLEIEVYLALVQYAHKVWPHLAPKNT